MMKKFKTLVFFHVALLGVIHGQTFSGSIQTPPGASVSDVSITVRNTATQVTLTTLNDENGTFFIPVADAGDYELSFEKAADPLNGVSTFDMLLISKYILGLIPLDTYYDLLSMDINGNGAVTVSDILYLRQMILGLSDEFPLPAWRFLERMDDPTDFVPSPEVDVLHFHIDTGETKVLDIIAVKTGDINGTTTGG